MTRKLLTTVLCLLIALTLPLSAMAATEHTLTILPGDDMRSTQTVADLLDALAIHLTTDTDAALLSLSLSGEDALSAALRADENGVYAQTKAVAEDVLYFTWDDVFTSIGEAAASQAPDEETAAAIRQSMEQSKQSLQASMTAGAAASDVSTEDTTAMMAQMFADDPAMLTWIADLMQRVEATDGDFTDPSHDAATHRIALTLTDEDMIKLCDTNYLKNTVEQTVRNENPNATDAEVAELIEQHIAQSKEMLEKSDISIPITALYTDDVPVAIDMGFDMTVPNTTTDANGNTTAESTVHVLMPITYRRLTTAEGVTHDADMNATMDDQASFSATFDALQRTDKSTTATLCALADGTQVTFAYDKTEADGTKDRSIAIYTRADAAAIVAPAAADRPIVTLNLSTKYDVETPAALDSVRAATPETAVQPLTLTGDAAKAFMKTASSNAMQMMVTLMLKLPASMRDAVFSGMQSIMN